MSLSNATFQQLSVKRLCNQNGVTGSAGQFLRSTGSEIEWGNGGGGSGLFVEQIASESNALNNYNLISNCVYLNCTGTNQQFSGFTVNNTSILGGDIVIIYNSSATAVRLLNQSTSSTATSRIICASQDGQFIGVGGSAQCVYDSSVNRWRCCILEFGEPVNINFNENSYTLEQDGTSTLGIVSTDVKVYSFVQLGNQLMVWHSVSGLSIAFAGTEVNGISVALPAVFQQSFYGSKLIQFPVYIQREVTKEIGYGVITGTGIEIYPMNDEWATVNIVSCGFSYCITLNIL